MSFSRHYVTLIFEKGKKNFISSYVCFYANAFYVCVSPFCAFFFFFRLA